MINLQIGKQITHVIKALVVNFKNIEYFYSLYLRTLCDTIDSSVVPDLQSVNKQTANSVVCSARRSVSLCRNAFLGISLLYDSEKPSNNQIRK